MLTVDERVARSFARGQRRVALGRRPLERGDRGQQAVDFVGGVVVDDAGANGRRCLSRPSRFITSTA